MPDMLNTFVDECFNPKDGDYSANLLDIVKDDSGNTLRQTVVEDSKGQILAQFDTLGAQMGGSATPIAQSANVLKLVGMLRDEPFASWVIPTEAMESSAIINTLVGSGISEFQRSPGMSMYCAEHQPATEGFPTAAIHGVAAFDAALVGRAGVGSEDCGLAPYGSCSNYGCITPVTCPVGDTVCENANSYLASKKQVAELNTFKCNLFDKNGVECDPKVSRVCCSLQLDGSCTLTVREITCNFKDYATYVEEFNLRIHEVFANIDDVQAAVGPKINNELRSTIQTTFIDAIDRVADGAGCGFLGMLYREMIEGLCYRGIYGLGKFLDAYIWVPVMICIMIIQAYLLWRWKLDNLEAARKRLEEEEDEEAENLAETQSKAAFVKTGSKGQVVVKVTVIEAEDV
jgi:hypothetical protein